MNLYNNIFNVFYKYLENYEMNLMHIEYPKTFLMECNEFEKIKLCTYYEITYIYF
jgi:hypothetical protein